MSGPQRLSPEEIERFMAAAIECAEIAAAQGEVPVGAVVVREGRIVGWGYNTREHTKNALDHAEMKAIDMACRNLGGWRLPGCAILVTLEPCSMCAGAIINARIDQVYYGASDPKFGACGSVTNLFSQRFTYLPHTVQGGVEVGRCRALLGNFFKELRAQKKAARSAVGPPENTTEEQDT